MAVFNITDHIVRGGQPRKREILRWLVENVGQGYGVGDPGRNVMFIGSGWEMRVERTINQYTEDLISEFVVDITNDAKSTHFALVWIK